MKMETDFDFSLLEEQPKQTEINESILDSDILVDKTNVDKQTILLNFINNDEL